MTQRLQTWILKNTGGLQTLVNDRLAKRSGIIGRFFKSIEIGPRQFSQHTLPRNLKMINYFWIQSYYFFCVCRPVLSRFLGVSNGPLNYSGLLIYFFFTGCVIAKFRFIRVRDNLTFNAQDNPEFWFGRYNLMFPPSFLHNRLSAHYIEINHIFSIEMLKRY